MRGALLTALCSGCVLLVACARRGEPAGCVPGASQPCACVNGWSGAQSCLADRTFEPCVCAGPPRVEAADAAIDAGTPAVRLPVTAPRSAAPWARDRELSGVLLPRGAMMCRRIIAPEVGYANCEPGCERWCACADGEAFGARRQVCRYNGHWSACRGPDGATCDPSAGERFAPAAGWRTPAAGASPTATTPAPQATRARPSLGRDDR